ncbi:DNA cytosine methyltransferase [Nocardia farcinica]|uniref:DNA cytosine methyltransferase n=1 Tax=Nocardia farcinica TaxID=37329 RepID=UPI00378A6BC2
MSRPAASDQFDMVDLFAGPGGLDVAAKWLGISAVGLEIDDDACMTRRAAGLPTDCVDVRSRKPEDYPGATILVGGPPCQTYSVAGSGAGRQRLDQMLELVRLMSKDGPDSVKGRLAELEDERTGLVLEPLAWILKALEYGRPYESVVLEQVPTVLPLWKRYVTVLESLGYKADARILHAEEFGVPQTRRRAILIAVWGRELTWPKPTHHRFVRGKPAPAGDDKLAWVPMAQVLGRQDEFVVVSNYGTGGKPEVRGRRFFDEPAYTVTGKVSRNRIVDLEDNYLAHISIADAGALQTFPRDYPWSGKDVSQQIGNAIPPRLAAHVLAAAVYGARPNTAQLDAAVAGSWRDVVSGTLRVQPDAEDLPAEPRQMDLADVERALGRTATGSRGTRAS